jgi:U32 family peptidase
MVKQWKRPEIVAPGGSIEAIEAAMSLGADAVYVGVGDLNARVRARNLTPAELEWVVPYVHSFGAKLYVVLNVPLRAETAEEAAHILAHTYLAGADAVILRDPMLMRAATAHCIGMGVHASTQHGVSSVGGMQQAALLGCRRVVLARELTANQIAKIRKSVPDTEIEVFVYGAMCFAISGSCLLGEVIGGRSGNYGACSQPCRLEYFNEAGESLGHYLSMKDLNLFPMLPELRRLKVSALKIEGRLKSPAYVGCVTHWLRKALDRDGAPGLSPDETTQFLSEVSVLFARPSAAGFLGGDSDRADLTCPEASGHRGLPVPDFSIEGKGRGAWVRFVAPVQLAIRDGLMVVGSAGRETPFSIREMTDGGRRSKNVVDAGQEVRVRLDARDPPQALFVHSSKVMENRYSAVARHVPGEMAAGNPPSPSFAEVELTADTLRLAATVGRYRHEATLPIATELARNEGFGPTAAGKLFGDADCQGGEGLYVNPKELKQARRDFQERCLAGREEEHGRLVRAILRQLTSDGGFQPEDKVLLTRGPVAVSRVTGFGKQRIRTSGGDWLELEERGKGTVVRIGKKQE